MGPRVRLDTVDVLRVVWMVAVKIIQIRFQIMFIQKERSCALTDSPILSRSIFFKFDFSIWRVVQLFVAPNNQV